MTYDMTTVVGYLGKTPELRMYDPSRDDESRQVANFSVAVNRYLGPDRKRTVWFNCSAWGNTGINIARYFKKGDVILVTGHVDADTWQKKSGETVSQLKMNVRSFSFVGSNKRDK